MNPIGIVDLTTIVAEDLTATISFTIDSIVSVLKELVTSSKSVGKESIIKFASTIASSNLMLQKYFACYFQGASLLMVLLLETLIH